MHIIVVWWFAQNSIKTILTIAVIHHLCIAVLLCVLLFINMWVVTLVVVEQLNQASVTNLVDSANIFNCVNWPNKADTASKKIVRYFFNIFHFVDQNGKQKFYFCYKCRKMIIILYCWNNASIVFKLLCECIVCVWVCARSLI